MAEITPGPGWWKATDGEWYPPRWEYRTIKVSLMVKAGAEKLEQELGEAGAAGWEAVGMLGEAHATAMVLLKRPIRL